MANSMPSERRNYRISIVSLSGREKGSQGVGKSCLCDRFIRPVEDDCRTDHISEVSQSDFAGSVVNSRHFLYWGRTEKTLENGTLASFEIVEQTEFADDATFTTFSGQAYVKRAAATKLESKGKIAYLSKDQMAIPGEYPVQDFPGKFGVDGFLVAFDSNSLIEGRNDQTQLQFLTKFLPILGKTKKPIVVAATKCDNRDEAYLKECEALVNRFVKNPHFVETSAFDDVNVDHAFFTLAHLIDKGNKAKCKIMPYAHANKARQQLLVDAKKAYQTELSEMVGDFQMKWDRCQRLMADVDVFQRFVELQGSVKARRIFIGHICELKEKKTMQKKMEYLTKLPKALAAILSDVDTDSTWEECQEIMKRNDEFEHYFVVLPDGAAWEDGDWLVSQDQRIPSGILGLDDATTIFDVHKKGVVKKKKRLETEKRLRAILDEAVEDILPGMTWMEVKEYCQSHYQFEDINDALGKPIWKMHEEKIRKAAKEEFKELLCETPHLFDFTRATNRLADQEPVFKKALQDDPRYGRLDHCKDDRSIIIWNHVAFLQKEPKIDLRFREGIAKTKRRGSLMINSNNWTAKPGNTKLKLLLLGANDLVHELSDEIKGLCSKDFEYPLNENVTYQLDIRIIKDDEVSTSSFASGEFTPNGCICIFSSQMNLQYVSRALEGHVICGLGSPTIGRLPFRGLPITLIQAVDPNMPEADQQDIVLEGEELSNRLQCGICIAKPGSRQEHQSLTSGQAREAIGFIIACIKHRETYISVTKHVEAELRLAMYVMDNDPYPVDQILGPLLRHQCCWRDPDQSNVVKLQVWIDGGYRCVEITLLSPQGMSSARRRPTHGFILAYSAIRRASYNNIKVLSDYLPPIPRLILAVTNRVNVERGISNPQSDELELDLLRLGQNLAIRRNLVFIATSAQRDQPESIYLPFFKEAWKKRFGSIVIQTGASQASVMAHRPPAPLPPEASVLSSPARVRSRAPLYEDFPDPSSHAPSPSSRRISAPQGPLQFTYLMEMRSSSSSPQLNQKAHSDDLDSEDDKEEDTAYAVVSLRPQEAEEEEIEAEPLYATPHGPYAGKKPARILSTKGNAGKRQSKPAGKVEEEEEQQYALVKDVVPGHFEEPQESEVEEELQYALAKDAVPDDIQKAEQLSVGDRKKYVSLEDAVPVVNPEDFYAVVKKRPKDTVPGHLKGQQRSEVEEEEGGHYALAKDAVPDIRKAERSSVGGIEDAVTVVNPEDLYAKVKKRPCHDPVYDNRKSATESGSGICESKNPPPAGEDDVDPVPVSHGAPASAVDPIYATPMDTTRGGSQPIRVVSTRKKPPSENPPPRPTHASTPHDIQARRIRRHGYETVEITDEKGLPVISQSGDHHSLPRTASSGCSSPTVSDSASEGSPLLKRRPSPNFARAHVLSAGYLDQRLKPKGRLMAQRSIETDESEDELKGKSVAEARKRASSQSELSLLSLSSEDMVVSPRASRQFFPSRISEIDFFYDDDGILCIEHEGSLSRSQSGDFENDWSPFFLSPDRRKIRDRQKLEAKRLKEQKKVEDRRRRELRKEEKRKARSPGPPYRKPTPRTWSYFGTDLQELEEIQRGAKLPIFVAKCIKAIGNHGMKTEGLYRVSGKKEVVDALKTKFDASSNLDFDLWAQENVHVLTTALKSFFQDLPEPLFPEQIVQLLLDTIVIPDIDKRKEKLQRYTEDGLPPLNYRILKHLVVHLHKVTLYSDVNKMMASNLSIVFWPTLVRPNITNIQDLIASTDISANLSDIMKTLIEDCNYYFGEVDTTDGDIIEIPTHPQTTNTSTEDLIDLSA